MSHQIDFHEIVGGDLEVPLLDGSTRRYVCLDNAASTPALRSVQKGVNRFMHWYSSIHRGAGFKSQLASWAYETSREMIVRFVGAEPAERVAIFGKNTTEATNKLANRFPFTEHDVLITSHMEHHSNDLPWRGHCRIERVRLTERGDIDLDHLENLLKQHSGNVKLVSVTGASNVSGIINPIHDIARLVHEHGAELFVDAAQLAPHREIRMGKKGEADCIDYLALSAHKMYAPYGTGVLIGWPEVFEQGTPDYPGGGTVKFVTADDVIWHDPPEKEEAGSPNVVGVIALGFAVRFLEQLGMDAVAEHEAVLTRKMISGLEKIERVEVYGSKSTETKVRLGVVPFNIRQMPHPMTAAILGCEFGIGVRHGCFCAHPYVQDLLNCPEAESEKYYSQILNNEPVDLPGLVRVSFGIYNTEEDVDVAVDAVTAIAAEKYQGKYEKDPERGGYWPEGYRPQYNDFFSF